MPIDHSQNQELNTPIDPRYLDLILGGTTSFLDLALYTLHKELQEASVVPDFGN